MENAEIESGVVEVLCAQCGEATTKSKQQIMGTIFAQLAKGRQVGVIYHFVCPACMEEHKYKMGGDAPVPLALRAVLSILAQCVRKVEEQEEIIERMKRG